MWFRNPARRFDARRSTARRFSGSALAAFVLSAALQACNTADHSGDPGLITITVDSAATKFSRLTVVLKDSAGAADTLFDDSLKSPAQLRRIATESYRGEKTVITLTGYQGVTQVYQETRKFDALDPAATKRDTVQDFSVPLDGLGWSASEMLLTLGDSTRALFLAAAPKRSDDRVTFQIGDSAIVQIRIVGKSPQGRIIRLVPMKTGPTWILARSVAYPGIQDSLSVLVSPAVQTVNKPVNKSPVWSDSPRPTWNWSSGGGKGIGYYRVRIDNDTLAAGKLVNDTLYTSPDALAHGTHLLYIQERDADANWSPTAALSIKVDLLPPQAPDVSNDGLNPTKERKPAWKWAPGGEGNGTFRYLLDGEDLEDSGTVTTAKAFSAADSLPEGPHTLRVQERDSAGNWSPSGSATVDIVTGDTTPPNPPFFIGSLLARASMPWRSGGGGSGHYRYLLNTNDFSKNAAVETDDSSYTPPPDSINVHNVLYVEERDSVGNWSAPARTEFGSVRFSFLESKIKDSDFVLTLIPDSNKVRLAHRVIHPKNDSERILQQRQLWEKTETAFNSGVAYLVNPFTKLAIRSVPVMGSPVTVAALPDTGNADFQWFFPVLVPPPPAGAYSVYYFNPDPSLHLNVSGDAPWEQTDPIILWEQGHGDDNEEWLLTTYNGARFVY